MKNVMKRMAPVLLVLLILGNSVLIPDSARAEATDIVITEVMASNGTWSGGHAYDWVELYNRGKDTADLSGWYLSDSRKKPDKWAFPEGTRLKPGSYLLVYCSGKTEEAQRPRDLIFYSTFKLSAKGDQVVLTDRNGLQVDILLRHRQDPSRNGQDLSHGPHGFGKGAADPVEGRQKQIPEVLAAEGPLGEPVGHQLLHDPVRVGQRQHAVPGVAGGQHAKVLAEHAAAAAVIGHGDNGSDVPDVALEAPEHGGKAVAAADGDHPGQGAR